jgi:hypothetical protein
VPPKRRRSQEQPLSQSITGWAAGSSGFTFNRRESLPMNCLAGVLIRERLRKLNMHHGWIGYLSASLALSLLGSMVTAPLSPFLKQAPVRHLENLTLGLWISWVLVAIVTGKDLSWRINRERLRIFPSLGFLRMYVLTLGLSFISFPLLAGVCIAQYWVHLRGHFFFYSTTVAFGGFLLFAVSVKLSASLVRSGIFLYQLLTGRRKAIAVSAIAVLSIGTAVAPATSRAGTLHPGILFGHILAGDEYVYSLTLMVLWILWLVMADFMIQRNLDYARMPGALTSNGSIIPNFILRFSPAWPDPIFRIGLLGWLRSRSSLMLFVWGSFFSFFWTYYSRPQDISDFFLFIFMNLLFHSYLRGNLLGIDRGGAWIYYGFPAPIEHSLSSKSLSLSLLQGCMIASLLIAGLLRTNPPFSLEDWCSILSYASSGIIIGEISGFYFSIRHPESIDRTSQFDGSTTAGAFMVGAIYFLFMLFFMQTSTYARNNLPTICYWGLLLVLPALLCIVRFLILKMWVHRTMLTQSEIILNKLSWY